MPPNRIANELSLQGEPDIVMSALKNSRNLVAGQPGIDEYALGVTLELRHQRAILAEPQEEVGQADLLCRLSHRRGP